MDIAREVYMYDEFYCVNPPDPPPPFLYFDMSSGSIPDDTSNSLPEDKMSILATSVFSWICRFLVQSLGPPKVPSWRYHFVV